MAAGVARDKAQGHVTINTETATIKAWLGLVCHHHAAEPKANNNTPNKNGLAIRSASWAKRGFWIDALCIKSTICENWVSSPTLATRTTTGALKLKLPATTKSPLARACGCDSPVKSASSVKVSPCTITPSAAKPSPTFTRIKSPTCKRATVTRSN